MQIYIFCCEFLFSEKQKRVNEYIDSETDSRSIRSPCCGKFFAATSLFNNLSDNLCGHSQDGISRHYTSV
ncbi:hypothetical protein HYN51_07935 [Limnobaculum parvum]|uniref:Uncharacterized protein n=1 Tax=Limnobaculum parvum TaxID=2172103 RepID=A0A2Y9TYM8_9GAMM|nr:hypothetical protein HYN51_07935 [Limnobaculum parvum]